MEYSCRTFAFCLLFKRLQEAYLSNVRYVALFALLAIACAPSPARQAFEVCQRQMEARNFDSAVTACEQASKLAPKNQLYASIYGDALLAQYNARADARTQRRHAESVAAAARAAAMAEQEQADILRSAELRKRLNEP